MSPGWPNGATHPPVMRRGLSGNRQGEPGELKHLSTRRRRKQNRGSRDPRDHPSSGERNGATPKPLLSGGGVGGATDGLDEATRSPLERGARDGDSPVVDGDVLRLVEFLSSARYEEPGAKPGGPPPKAEDSRVTDSGLVP